MTRTLLAMAAAIALAGGLAIADDQDAKTQAEEWVRQLGSDDVAVREKATDELSKLGPEAVPVLEEAAKSTDPEVQWRAEKALAKIKEGSQPQTQPQEDHPKQAKRKGNGFSSSVSIQVIGPGRVSIRRDGSGAVSITVTEEDENGEKVTKTYEADSAAAFKEKYPDIAKKYGIDADDDAGPQVGMPPGLEDLDEMFKDMPARIQEMIKRLQQGQGLIPGPRKPQPPAPAPEDTPPAPVEPEPTDPPEGVAASLDDFGAEVSFIDEALRDQLDLPGDHGVVVREVAENSPAAKAGLEEHDVVLSVNGEPVKTKWDFRRLLIEGSTSGKLELAIVREGAEKTLVVDPALLRK